jgi:hypothetical protein
MKQQLAALSGAVVVLATSVLTSKPAKAAPPTMPGKWRPPALTAAQLASRPSHLVAPADPDLAASPLVSCYADPAEPTYEPEFTIVGDSYFTCKGPIALYSFATNLWRRNGNGSYTRVASTGEIAPLYPRYQIVYDSCTRGSIYGYHTEAIAKWFDGVGWHDSDVNSISVFLTCG